MTLFGDWLTETAKLQLEAYGSDLPNYDPEQRAESVRMNVTAIISELGEMLDEVGWKPWGTDRTIDRDAYAGEIVDILHFIANLAVVGGLTDERLNELYSAKMQKNRDRQLAGYDGRVEGKCPVCKRALDDSAVKCTVQDGEVFCASTQISLSQKGTSF